MWRRRLFIFIFAVLASSPQIETNPPVATLGLVWTIVVFEPIFVTQLFAHKRSV